MTIGIFCDSFFPENKAVAVRLFHFAEAFADLGNTVVTVHTSTRKEANQKLNYNVIKNICPTPSNESSNLVRLITELLLGVETFFRILFSGYKIVLISSPPFFASSFAAAAASLRGIPFVFDVRDEYPEVFFTAGLIRENSLLGKILLRIEKKVYLHAFQVISVTEGICARIDQKVGQRNKAMLVRNGFDENLFSPVVEKEKKFTVVFHGNIGKFQDPDLILAVAEKVFEKNKDIAFRVIGFGNNDAAMKVNRSENIEFLGMVPYHDIPSIIASAHLGISFRSDDLISRNSFPVKLYEYIGVGLPVVITPMSEAGLFFEENKIGFQFDNIRVDEIAGMIVQLSKDQSQYQSMMGMVIRIRHLFSRQKISKNFAEQLMDSLNKRLEKHV